MPYFFAHGVLRKGGRNNSLVSAATFLGNGETVEDYALFTMNNKCVVTKRPVSKIKGEVYYVTDQMLTLVDRFEGHPRINKRELVGVRLEDGSTTEAWVYFHVQPLRQSILAESGEYPDLNL